MAKIQISSGMGTGRKGIIGKFTRVLKSGRQLTIDVDGKPHGTASVTQIRTSPTNIRIRRSGKTVDSFKLPRDATAKEIVGEIRSSVRSRLPPRGKAPKLVKRKM